MVGYAEKSANGCPPGSLAADTVGSLGADGRLKHESMQEDAEGRAQSGLKPGF